MRRPVISSNKSVQGNYMQKTTCASIVMLLTILICPAAEKYLVALTNRAATITIAENGALSALIRNDGGRNYLAPGQPAPLLSVRVAWNGSRRRISPSGTPGETVDTAFRKSGRQSCRKRGGKATRMRFSRLVDLQPTNRVELVCGGHIPQRSARSLAKSSGWCGTRSLRSASRR